ncbi:MAG: helix-turn-helix transcriptional regulator [Nitrospira sp.]|nr:helix-turn-helix transcriptional regulator [Nitrospira sp.]
MSSNPIRFDRHPEDTFPRLLVELICQGEKGQALAFFERGLELQEAKEHQGHEAGELSHSAEQNFKKEAVEGLRYLLGVLSGGRAASKPPTIYPDCMALRLAELRKRHGLSMEEMSKIAGISDAMYKNYEWGCYSPSLTSLWRVCRRFNVSLDWLCGVKDGVEFSDDE